MSMWFYLALLSAFFSAFSNIARRTHGSLAQPAELSWWTLLFSLPLGLGLLLVSNQTWHIGNDYLIPLLSASLISCFSGVLLFRAYKYGDASAVSPISNLLPILLVPTSFLMLGLVPTWGGLAGILIVVVGVYYSSVSGKHSLLHPFRQLLRNRGSKAMLACVVLWSISGNLQKMALDTASPSYVLFLHQVTMFSVMSIYLLLKKSRQGRWSRGERVMRRWGWHIAAISFFTTLSVFFQMQAIALVNPSYVSAVKRLDVLLTVLFAGLFLQERHILKRFRGSVVAIVGVAIIYFFR